MRLGSECQIESRNEEIGIYKTLLPRKSELQLTRRAVVPLVDEPADLGEMSGLVLGYRGAARWHKQPLVGEDDALIERPAERICAERAVAANQAFFPGPGRLGTDEPVGGDRQR